MSGLWTWFMLVCAFGGVLSVMGWYLGQWVEYLAVTFFGHGERDGEG
jgi:hypothetical protein